MKKIWFTSLGYDIIHLSDEKCIANDFSDRFPCVELDCISQGLGAITHTIDISETRGVRNKFTSGQVLYGKLRPYLNKYARPNFDGACSTEIWVLDTKDKTKLLQDYLFYLVQSKEFRDAACTMAGTKMPRSSWKVIEATDFLLPPLSDQERIVEILSDADAAITIAEDLSHKFWLEQKQRRNLIVDNLVSKYKNKQIHQLAEISIGASKKKWICENGRYTILDMGGISEEGELILRKRTNWNEDMLSVGDLIVPKDDIGKGHIIGKAGYVDKDNQYVLGDHVFKLSTYHIIPRYLQVVINSSYFRKQVLQIATGSAQLGINQSNFSELLVAVPPLDIQKAVASVYEQTAIAKELMRAQIEGLKRQKKGLMQKLLTGKLRVA